MRGNILVIDDELKVFSNIKKGLPAHNIYYASSLPKIKETFKRKEIDLAIVDLNIKIDGKDRFSGLDYIKTIRNRYPNVTVMVLSSYRDIERITTAVKNGADRYVYKGKLRINSDKFREEIRQMVNSKKNKDKIRKDLLAEIWGEREYTPKVMDSIKKFAETKQSFLLVGEPGLGQEGLIRWMHTQSPSIKVTKEPVVVDLGRWGKKGLLDILNRKHGTGKDDFLKKANYGILYLKQINKTSKAIQEGFLKIIETQKYLDAQTPLHIQFIMGIESNPYEELSKSKLSPLMLSALPNVNLVPLSDRKIEIPELIFAWLKKHTNENFQIEDSTMNHFQYYEYPGNILELYALLEETVKAHREKYGRKAIQKKIAPYSLPSQVTKNGAQNRKELKDMKLHVAHLELTFIENALKKHYGEPRYKTRVADALDISTADNLKKTYINKYKKLYPNLIQQFPWIIKAYKLDE